jgi:hypothetical protein
MKDLENFVQHGNNAQAAVDRIINDVHAVNHWNEQHDIGTPVSVRMDDGKALETVTHSVAWMLGGHTAVIMLEGISGGYKLDRVTPGK